MYRLIGLATTLVPDEYGMIAMSFLVIEVAAVIGTLTGRSLGVLLSSRMHPMRPTDTTVLLGSPEVSAAAGSRPAIGYALEPG